MVDRRASSSRCRSPPTSSSPGSTPSPTDVYEAARVDGASPCQAYWRITLPLLRPALLVATVLNIIYVFNSFPIIYTLNDRNPGFAHDTTITFMYKLAFKSAEKDVGMSAAAGIFNVVLILRGRHGLPAGSSDGGRRRADERGHRRPERAEAPSARARARRIRAGAGTARWVLPLAGLALARWSSSRPTS